MRVTADVASCVGAGMCALTAPAVFDQSEESGTVVLLDETPPPELHAAVRRARYLCPSGAVSVRDGHDDPARPGSEDVDGGGPEDLRAGNGSSRGEARSSPLPVAPPGHGDAIRSSAGTERGDRRG
ncbi:ferredoxin [Streptosporangium longisporum]